MKKLLILSVILVLGYSFSLTSPILALSEVLHPFFDLEKETEEKELHVVSL
jgi:hypothetical protein